MKLRMGFAIGVAAGACFYSASEVSLNHEQTAASAEGATPTQTDAATHTATATPEHTTTSTASPKVVSLLTEAACVSAMPDSAFVDAKTMYAINSTSKTSELVSFARQHPAAQWIAMAPKKTKDGGYDFSPIEAIHRTTGDIMTIVATDDEGGEVERFVNTPPTTKKPIPLPAEAIVAKAYSDPNKLQASVAATYAYLKAHGITMNLAPVADIGGDPKTTYGRTFASKDQANTYLPAYLRAAQSEGIIPTVKHFAGGLGYGNTDTKPVTTPSYAELKKAGVFEPYATVGKLGVQYAVMMGTATPPGWPDSAKDNHLPASLNPAAYEALRDITGGDPLTVSDNLHGGVRGVNNGKNTTAGNVVSFYEAGGDIAIDIQKDLKGDTASALQAEQSAIYNGVMQAITNKKYTRQALQDSALQIWNYTGTNACDVLELADNAAYAALKNGKKPKPVTPSTTTASPTATTVPGKSGDKPTGTTVPAKPTTKPTADPAIVKTTRGK